MECKKNLPKDYDHYVYRVDIGSSRGFDVNGMLNEAGKSRLNEARFLKSRTPQVLEIFDREFPEINIIKSKIRNTRIHVPRQTYENTILDNTILARDIIDLNMFPNEPYYQKKYLKYKNKYLSLQSKLSI